MEILYTATNDEDAMQAEVREHEKGFGIVLRDLDSGLVVPVIAIAPDLATAKAKADSLVK